MIPVYTIGPARPEDLAQLPLIELAAARLLCGHAPESVLSETSSQDELQTALRDGRLWVARADDTAVGFAHVTTIDAGSAHLEEVDVLPAHGRRGLGTRLVRHVCNWAASSGYESVTLTTFREVPFNMPFYQRLGFRVLPPAELPPSLRARVLDEARRGLDPSSRVVMKRPCDPERQQVDGPTPDLVPVSDSARSGDIQFLEEQINEYNFATTGIHDARLLVAVLRDDTGRLYAGVSGHTWGGVAEVRLLWVEESRRHTGIGSRLLQAAENEARARGCGKIVLSTHSFQAPAFYAERGYVGVGAYADYPRGHRSLFLEKSLA